MRHNLGCNMAKTITKAEDVDLSWLSDHEGGLLGHCHGQIVTMREDAEGYWTAWINGEAVENEDGTGIDSWPSKEEAAQVVMAMCEIMAEHEQGD